MAQPAFSRSVTGRGRLTRPGRGFGNEDEVDDDEVEEREKENADDTSGRKGCAYGFDPDSRLAWRCEGSDVQRKHKVVCKTIVKGEGLFLVADVSDGDKKDMPSVTNGEFETWVRIEHEKKMNGVHSHR